MSTTRAMNRFTAFVVAAIIVVLIVGLAIGWATKSTPKVDQSKLDEIAQLTDCAQLDAGQALAISDADRYDRASARFRIQREYAAAYGSRAVDLGC